MASVLFTSQVNSNMDSYNTGAEADPTYPGLPWSKYWLPWTKRAVRSALISNLFHSSLALEPKRFYFCGFRSFNFWSILYKRIHPILWGIKINSAFVHADWPLESIVAASWLSLVQGKPKVCCGWWTITLILKFLFWSVCYSRVGLSFPSPWRQLEQPLFRMPSFSSTRD